jgi:hypothetical protein
MSTTFRLVIHALILATILGGGIGSNQRINIQGDLRHPLRAHTVTKYILLFELSHKRVFARYPEHFITRETTKTSLNEGQDNPNR